MDTDALILPDIFKNSLAEQLAAEKKYLKVLEKISGSLMTDEFKSAISPSETDIESHISRLSGSMAALKQKSAAKPSVIDDELLSMLKAHSGKGQSILNDILILHIIKLIFSIKVSRYESLHRMASALGYQEYAMLLEQCSKDDQNTIAYLNQIEQNVMYPEVKK
ncbi:DUF892 family protein [Pedobacter hartonius]|uniref:Ferritin-like metal-binding protein YciE n=1 Tax=Pedobacter hartonius TaxID=425514 RepID=A0A1H4GK37_9SPHI|nr:DUF892 family protein [Pedobacter hartonius]SEB09966.1 Ferritin-like metal-binding protein YciE [Pedobacter hartonius]